MATIKLEGFGGLVPRTSPRLLPPNAATKAENTKLLNGELRGFRAPREEADFTSEYFTVRRAFRIRDDAGIYQDTWLVFDSRDVDVVRSPLINDAFDRYYWAGDGRPKMNTSERIQDGLGEYFLGVPTPSNKPSVSPPAGTDTTRAYVYTFVSAYGEEGPPSPPEVVSGANSGTWAITSLPTTVPDASNRNITKKRIYRTVPGNDSSLFFRVAEIDLATSNYDDTRADIDVVEDPVLESTTWLEPPTDLEGFVAMPNGYLVGWAGRRIVFSEPYRPHAWPAEYELATEFPVVSMVVWGSSLIIGTESQPYIGQGVNPASFTLQKMDAVEPCLSRRGMVATVAGAYYPSINGLVLANANGVQVITQDILTKEEWAAYNPESLFAAQLGLQYIAFYDDTNGLIFNPTEPNTKFVSLSGFQDVQGIETDRYSGNVLLISQDRAWNWDPEDVERLFWRWQSKVFQLPKPVNFGALRIQFDSEDADVETDTLAYYGSYNDLRFDTGPLNTLGGHTLCGTPQGAGDVPSWTEPEIRMPLGGSLLYPVNTLAFQNSAVRIRVLYGKGNVALDAVISSERIVRVPTGFKSDLWQFEMIGNTTVYSVQIAETAKELAAV